MTQAVEQGGSWRVADPPAPRSQTYTPAQHRRQRARTRLPDTAAGRGSAGQELGRAGQRGQLRVVVFGDLPAGALAQDLDQAEKVQRVEFQPVPQIRVGREARRVRRSWPGRCRQGRSGPRRRRSCSTVPVWNDSTSMADLAVSMTAITSPLRTSSPGLTSHSSTVPSSMSAPRAGMRNSATSAHHLARRGDDPFRLRAAPPPPGAAGRASAPRRCRPARPARRVRRTPAR